MEKVKLLLGKRIRELREKRGLSQEQFANLAGLGARNLSKIECGIVFPSKCLDKLSEAFGIEFQELFEFKHFEYTNEDKKEYIRNRLDELTEDKLTFAFKMFKSI